MESGRSESPRLPRRRILFRGRVQGVGFRYTTRRIAKGFAVAGYVKNLPDGTVELAVEGEGAAIDGFLKEIGRTFPENIRGLDAAPLESDEDFPGFEIRR